jgi:hypothetical protein
MTVSRRPADSIESSEGTAGFTRRGNRLADMVRAFETGRACPTPTSAEESEKPLSSGSGGVTDATRATGTLDTLRAVDAIGAGSPGRSVDVTDPADPANPPVIFVDPGRRAALDPESRPTRSVPHREAAAKGRPGRRARRRVQLMLRADALEPDGTRSVSVVASLGTPSVKTMFGHAGYGAGRQPAPARDSRVRGKIEHDDEGTRMQELRLVAVSEDGTYLVLATAGRGTRFTLPVDDRLRAAVRGNFSRLGQYEIEVESPLRPKEIQARIRAGETAEEIAATAGIPVERVRWFEGPVLQEREYMAQQAQRVAVRLPGASAPGPTLGELVAERLTRRGVPADEIDWDSCKRDDGMWRVKLGFVWNGHTRNAEWLFDPRRRHITPHDDEAMRLSAADYVEPPAEDTTVTPFVPRVAKLQPVPSLAPEPLRQPPVAFPAGRRPDPALPPPPRYGEVEPPAARPEPVAGSAPRYEPAAPPVRPERVSPADPAPLPEPAVRHELPAAVEPVRPAAPDEPAPAGAESALADPMIREARPEGRRPAPPATRVAGPAPSTHPGAGRPTDVPARVPATPEPAVEPADAAPAHAADAAATAEHAGTVSEAVQGNPEAAERSHAPAQSMPAPDTADAGDAGDAGDATAAPAAPAAQTAPAPAAESTAPKPTVPKPTVPKPTVPKPTVPKPTVPKPTTPEPSTPEPAGKAAAAAAKGTSAPAVPAARGGKGRAAKAASGADRAAQDGAAKPAAKEATGERGGEQTQPTPQPTPQPAPQPAPQQPQPPAPAPSRPARKGRGRRASVPTWDEIMFGARRPE